MVLNEFSDFKMTVCNKVVIELRVYSKLHSKSCDCLYI